MDVIEHARMLAAMPMFATLDESQLKLLAFTSQVFDYAEGEYLFHRNDISDAVYVIMRGRVRIEDDATGSNIHIADKTEGEVVGEMGVLRAERRSATVLVTEDTEALRIPGDRYLDLVSGNPGMALYVMRDLSDKLASTSADLARVKAGADMAGAGNADKARALPLRDPDALDASLYRYIWRHTRKDQVLLILLTLLTMPLVYLTLEVPKIIVNEALSREGAQFDVLGLQLDQVQYLLFLSVIFLLLIFASGGIKYAVNVYRGVVGERMLRRFRYTLFSRLLRFPMTRFRDLSAGEAIPMVTAETEPLGGFIGDSIALPVFQGGLLITYVWFIFVQDFWLGLAAIALYPPQAILIPRLQKKINALGGERVRTMRKVSDRIGESVHGAADIRVNATGALERADLGDRLGKVFRIREEIYRRKFFVKFLSNFLGHLTPFFFYSIGGYLVIRGELSLGALVAVLAAYKDIGPPWRELLKFYQTSATVRIKYAQIIDQFQSDGLSPDRGAAGLKIEPARFTGSVEAGNVRVAMREHGNLLENISATINLDEHVGVLAMDAEAARQFSLLMTGLLPPTSGRLRVDGVEMDALPLLDRGRNIGLCNADSFLFNASIRDNLYYGLKQQPVAHDAAGLMDDELRHEAERSGNSTHPVDTEWCDAGVAGVASPEALPAWARRVIDTAGLKEDIYAMALESYLPDDREDLQSRIVSLRDPVQAALAEVAGGRAVEPFDRNRFCHSITVAENLLFGTPVEAGTTLEDLLMRDGVQKELKSSGLHGEFLRVGSSLTDFMLDLFSGVDEESDLFAKYSFIDAQNLERYRELAVQVRHRGLEHVMRNSRGCCFPWHSSCVPTSIV